MGKISKLIKDPSIIIKKLGYNGYLNFIPDNTYLKMMYKLNTGKNLNLDNPKTFNEKLQWLKLYDRKIEYTKMVDKYAVRDYIKSTIGEEYLIPLLGVYDTFDEINFEKLPNQFVIKTTHDCGGVVICKDKNKFDKNEARRKINKHINRNYYYAWREWPYKNVKPRIICEKYIYDKSKNGLNDYKFFCFDGNVKLVQVNMDRNRDHTINFYDIDWNLIDLSTSYRNKLDTPIEKPFNFENMINIAQKLSKNIPYLRVDLYNVEGKIYFGELTFYHQSGYCSFNPNYYDEIIGNWIDINNKI